MFFGLLNPVPLVRGTDPDSVPSVIIQNLKKNLYVYWFVTSLLPFIFENDVNARSKSNKQSNLEEKNIFFGILKVKDENSRIQSQIRIHGSEARIHNTGTKHLLCHTSTDSLIVVIISWERLAFALVSNFLYELCIIRSPCMSSVVYFSNFLGVNVQSGQECSLCF